MDAIGDYGSDDSASSSSEGITNGAVSQTAAHNIGTVPSSGAKTNSSHLEANPNNGDETRKRKSSDSSTPGSYFHLLPHISSPNPSDCMISLPPPTNAAADQTNLAMFHQTAQEHLIVPEGNASPAHHMKKRDQLVSSLYDGSSYAETIESTKLHEFRNPLYMERTMKQLNIQDPLGTNCVAEPVFDWESNLVYLEEQARIQQQQVQQQQHPF